MLHPHHPQSLCRHRRPRFRPVFQLVELVNIFRLQSSPSHFQQRSHHLPHHVPQKRPPMHREPQFFPILRALQLRRKNLPHHIPLPVVVFRSRRSRKRREIVHSHKPRRCSFHRLFIQRKWVVQHIPPQRRRHHLPAIKPVPVNFSFRRPARIKIRTRLRCSHDSDRRRQQRIQRPLKLLRRKRRLCPEAPHLPEGMHTRIRPPRAVQLNILLRQPPQHGHQFALHCRFICLDLPAVEIRPVVRNRQLKISHCRRTLIPPSRSPLFSMAQSFLTVLLDFFYPLFSVNSVPSATSVQSLSCFLIADIWSLITLFGLLKTEN